ncbi:hypothetical protein LTR56_012720 [Elasticomyces elasticus]|nr:hypothetical protein LTR22_022995 [Elasticomyces elasticus]KAK3638997.1 hypothetical protein LTR56_012720 [Elasticomyces elasticus]KAK4918749.1 hypothetical protein LTR49_013536 [Elasticomyces elasticus]KAK5754422.1 hypothetical protein LTS12_015491 [Elasticomyces elasticus]
MASAQKTGRQEWQISERLPHSITHNGAGTSRLMDLPAELRNTIWEYVMSVGTVHVQLQGQKRQLRAFVLQKIPRESAEDRSLKLVKSTTGLHSDSERPAGQQCLALLRSCKQINGEAKQLFYVSNRFEIQAFYAERRFEENDGRLYPGMFFPEDTAENIVSTMEEFTNAIGHENTGVIEHVRFHFGQIDEDDISERIFKIIQQVLDLLRPLYTSRPSWCFAVGMTLLIYGRDGEGYEDIRQEVVFDPRDVLRGKEAAIAALKQIGQRGITFADADMVEFLDKWQDLKW